MTDTISAATQAADISLPNPDIIRAAIDEADERARLLRQLLRVALRLQLHRATDIHLPTPKEAGRAVQA